MHFRLLFALLPVFATAVLSAVPAVKHINTNGPLGRRHPLPMSAHEPLTNARRLARGLGPARPKNIARGHRLRRSPSYIPYSGVIKVSGDAIDGQYVSTQANAFGEFSFTSDLTEALHVDFNWTSAADPVTFVTTNGFTNFPALAAIKGFSSTSADLGPGHPANYAYIGAATATDPHAPATAEPNSYSAAVGQPDSVETAIFTVDPDTLAITPNWVNTDGSVAETSFIYVPASEAFILVGSADAFHENYGSGTPVAWQFQPDSD